MARVKPSENLKKLNLLYVEDEEAIREPFRMMIERYFKNVYVGKNGEEGLELFKNNSIDIVISDIKMPKMTGLEMAKEIKNINPDTPIIFTTAFGDREYLKEAIDLGVDGYIIKPVDRNKLFTRLNFLADSIIAQEELIQYTKLIKTLFDYQKDALVLFDRDFNIRFYNKVFNNIFMKENITTLEALLNHCTEDNGENLQQDELINIQKEKTIVCKYSNNDIIKYFELFVEEIDSELYLLAIDDITTYKLEAEKMKEDAMIDELTGLYNRKKLEEIEKDIINHNLCFIIFDIDNFKKINDTYGHLKGDEVLKALADTVKHSLRGSDLVIRWGGEEFLVILRDMPNIDITRNLAEKLRVKINQIEIPEVGHFSCSFGISCGFVSSQKDIQNILDKADEFLYKAKRNGKNRVEG